MKKQRENKIPIIAIVGVVVFTVIVGIGIKIYQRGQAKTYIFPKELIDYAGLTVERQIEAIKRDNKTEDVCTAVYANEDGSLSLELNEKQQKGWIDNTTEKIEKSIEKIEKNGGVVEVSEDRKRVIFEIPSSFKQEILCIESGKVTIFAAEYQILTENTENWEIYVCFKKSETGEIIAEGTLPYDTIEFTNEDLK